MFINNITMTERIPFYFEFHIDFYSIICHYYLKSRIRADICHGKCYLIFHKLSGGFQL